MSVDRKMKPRYLGPMIVVKKLQEGAYILAELDGSVWQNSIPYLLRKKMDFMREVQELLDASEENLKELTAGREEISLENADTITIDL